MDRNQKKFQVGLWASRMSFGTLISRLLGFVRDMLIATFFSRTQTDIFFVAFRFPNFFRRFLGEGSFSASVTPSLTKSLQEKGKDFTKDLSSALFTILFCGTSFLTVLGCLFMPEMMEFLFKNTSYSLVEGKLDQTIQVGRIVFVYLFFVSSYSYFMSVAQVFGRFFLPALAPALFNAALILFILSPSTWWSFPALSLAWAVVVGGMIQVALILYIMSSIDFWPRFLWNFKTKEFKSTLSQFAPAAIGLSGLSLIGLVNLYFAGWLEEGTHTYIYYGDRLLELPRSLIAISIGTALVPELSRLKTLNQVPDFVKTTSHYLNFLLFLVLPSALVFCLIPEPIIRVLFQRGEFDLESVLKTALILKIYSVVLIFSSIARIFSSCFFAIQKNWELTIANGLYVFFHALSAWGLTYFYGFTGLIWSTALSSIFYVCVLLFLMSRYFGKIHRFFGGYFLLKLLPGLLLLAACIFCYEYIYNFGLHFLSHGWSQFLSLFFVLSLGSCFYIGSSLLLKEPIVYELKYLLKRKHAS
ncbi:MAG: murein biosynthesis integral membrane protein MurJ [Bdellovibrionales bacterium]